MTQAIVIRIVSNQYSVLIEGEVHKATAMGKLRLGIQPVVGDSVVVEWLESRWVIQEVLERKNELIRPRVANVDQALIVMSAAEPDFSFTLVDRLIFLISLQNIEPVIVVSKGDLLDDTVLAEIEAEYKSYGYKVVVTGKHTGSEAFRDILNGKISVLAGQSGVGKSSLINRIIPDLDLQTQEISKALGRGKHTTRHNQLYPVEGGWVADTPGFSSLDFSEVDAIELSQAVPDFKPYIGQCRYRNCLHDKEPSCKIKDKVKEKEISSKRYKHYVECLSLIKEDFR